MNISIFPAKVSEITVERGILYIDYTTYDANLKQTYPMIFTMTLPPRSAFSYTVSQVGDAVEIEILWGGRRVACFSIFGTKSEKTQKDFVEMMKDALESYEMSDYDRVLKMAKALPNAERKRLIEALGGRV